MASMRDEIASLVRSEIRDAVATDILRNPTSMLLGVDRVAAAHLKLLEVSTIFDLATSEVFSAAMKIVEAGDNNKSLIYQHGAPSADLIREANTAGISVDRLKTLKIVALERVPTESADAIANALDVSSIWDLSLYPPYRAARTILDTVYFPENAANLDLEQPADLLPKNGEYPTERVQYTTLVMDEIRRAQAQQGIDISSDNFKPIDLAKLADADQGFQKIAFGALITMNQSWYAQGVTLGHLLHSVSLAPGESTRVAVVDWTRKSKAGQTEVVQEEDQLENETQHNRALNEVTQAVAREAQEGFSQSNSSSLAQSAGVAVSASASYFGMASVDVEANHNVASTTSSADSYSTSSGQRNMAASMMQNVNDRTHQNAHSTRSKRASVVKEVSQSEHEEISARVIANYNHMHALTIQYYEVVQVYKTRVAIAKVDKVVFIPIQLVDFNNDDLVHRFKHVLIRASPTQGIRDALQNLDVVELAPVQETRLPLLGGTLRDVRIRPSELPLFRTAVIRPGVPSTPPAPSPPSTTPAATPLKRKDPLLPSNLERQIIVKDALWNRGDQISRLTSILSRPILREKSESLFLPLDAVVEGVTVTSGNASMSAVFKVKGVGERIEVSADQPLPISQVESISVRGNTPDKDIEVDVQMTINRAGTRFPLELPSVTVHRGAPSTASIVLVKAASVSQNVKKFLNENKFYYSTAIFRSLDPTQLALLLSGYTIERTKIVNGLVTDGKEAVSLSQAVEPRPIRYVGNYLAFKMNQDEDDSSWNNWLKLRNLKVGDTSEDIVPLPSGGTFAEAVLGRYNCAEKLDITRFWNWQDSPIPLLPSDIAAIQTGKHDTADGLTSSGLSNPIINMAAPSSLPDPLGTGAILSAIQNGNMFRDQSGMQATIGLAATSTEQAVTAATSAGQQASTNLANRLKADTERQRIKAQRDVAMLQATGSGNNSQGGLNHSQDGAKINYFDKNKNTPEAAIMSANRMSTSAPTSIPGSSGGTSGSVGRVTAEAGRLSSSTFSQNPAALAATWGDAQPRSALFEEALDSGNVDFQLVSTRSNQPFDESTAAPWRDLIDFEVSAGIVEDLKKRDITIQKIGNASGGWLNVDLYMVRIDKYPTVNGVAFDNKTLLSHIRKNLPDNVSTWNSKFSPFDENLDKARWLSDSPVGAVLRIDIVGPDNAAVVVSEADDKHWRFATVRTPFRETGSHPVSGNREFGMFGNYVYTRGADRATDILESIMTEVTFAGGDHLWSSFQANVKAFVDENEGQATITKPLRHDLKWEGGIPSWAESLGQAASSGMLPIAL